MESLSLIESFTEDQQMQVYSLMSLGDIEDINLAAQLLLESDFDVNKAAQKLLDMQHKVTNPLPNTTRTTQQSSGQRSQPSQRSQPVSNPENELKAKYKTFYEKKLREEEEEGITDSLKKGVNGVITSIKGGWNNIVPTFLRGNSSPGEAFEKYLRSNYKDLPKSLKLNSGSFDESLVKANESKRPLLIYIHVDDSIFKKIPDIVFRDENLIKFYNGKFHLIGVILNQKGNEKISEFIESKNCPCLAAFRMNIVDEPALIEFITLDDDSKPETILTRLRGIDDTYITILAEEDRIKSQVKREVQQQKVRNMMMNSPFGYMGGYDDDYGGFQGGYGGYPVQQQQYQPSPEEIQRLEEDRLLRQLQEEEYKEAEKKIREMQNKKQEEERLKQSKKLEEENLKKKKEEEERLRRIEIEETKKKKKAGLPDEPNENEQNIVLIVFRLPDGGRIQRRYRLSEKVESMYDYVDTLEIKFDPTTTRYDLMQPRPFLCLDDKSKSIGEYFDGSAPEVINIRELSD